MSSDPTKSIAQRFFSVCVLILLGVLAIWLALDVLSRIWGWLVLIAAIGLSGYVAYILSRRWRRW